MPRNSTPQPCCSQPSEAALADLQKLLMDEEKMPFLLTAVRGGRAGLDRFMQWAQNNNLSLIKELPARALPPAEKFRLLLPGSLEEERAALIPLGIPNAQGFLFGRPRACSW